MLFCGLKLGGEGGDDEATEGTIELVGCCAEKFGIGASNMFVSGFAVLDVTVLPIGETVWIGHFRFAEAHGFGRVGESCLWLYQGAQSTVGIVLCVR